MVGLKAEIKCWLKDYDNNEEHDFDLALGLKDDARDLLERSLFVLEKIKKFEKEIGKI